jgi:hypothetical protein
MRVAAGLGLVLATLAAGCVTERYVGSISQGRLYANRGYGVLVRLPEHQLEARWAAIDPNELDSAPKEARPAILDSPLDVDGDGALSAMESTRHLRPMLRLLSKTSSGTHIDVDVFILGGDAGRAAPLADLFQRYARELLEVSGLDPKTQLAVEPRRAGPDFDALVGAAAGPRGAFRLALIDQGSVLGEEKKRRRQVVKVALVAPSEKAAIALAEDHGYVIDALVLNREAGPILSSEAW